MLADDHDELLTKPKLVLFVGDSNPEGEDRWTCGEILLTLLWSVGVAALVTAVFMVVRRLWL